MMLVTGRTVSTSCIWTCFMYFKK